MEMEKAIVDYAQIKAEEMLNHKSDIFQFMSLLPVKKTVKVKFEHRPPFRYGYGEVWTVIKDKTKENGTLEFRITLFKELFRGLSVEAQKEVVHRNLFENAFEEINNHCALFEFCEVHAPKGPQHWDYTFEFFQHALTLNNTCQEFMATKVRKYQAEELYAYCAHYFGTEFLNKIRVEALQLAQEQN